MKEAPSQIPISAVQHWRYCPRQWGLIHLDGEFEENIFTLRGRLLHDRVDEEKTTIENGVKIARGLTLFCDAAGLYGKADAVEFRPNPYPVEYKRGSKHKRSDIAECDFLQLAAQSLCLEEMFGCAVPEGAIFYAESKRRQIVAIDSDLRKLLAQTIDEIRSASLRDASPSARAVASDLSLRAAQKLPPPTADRARCDRCSLAEICMPNAIGAESDRLYAELWR